MRRFKDLYQRALDEVKYLEPAQKDIVNKQNKIKSKNLER